MRTIRIIDWISGFFKPKAGQTINFSTYRDDSRTTLSVDMCALFTVIEFISGVMSKCEVKTFIETKEVKKFEWACLNVEPNKNQNASDFWNEIIAKLLYYGEVVVFPVGNQLIIADTFSKEEFAVKDNEYTDLTRKDFTSNRRYRERDVLHFQYKAAGVQRLFGEIMEQYSRLIEGAADKYYKDTGEKGVLHVSTLARGNQQEFEENFKNLKSNYFKSYFKERNSVLPLFEGYDYSPTTTQGQYTNEISDIRALMDDALSRTAQAYRVPSSVIKGDTSNMDGETYRMLMSHCFEPIAQIITRELTKKKHSIEEIVAGSRMKFDTSHIKHYDLLECGVALEKLVSNTLLSTNEGRNELGLQPLDVWWADMHIMTKNYTSAEIAMKGDANGNETLGNKE